ncbi:DUF6088 family protein [Inquilinus sp. OTU3971]|uniref:DUF6088 family protein n=1 Tax=Inquilinus sp. OTU3971 TaxID=3043855 RepID=UPI00313B3429
MSEKRIHSPDMRGSSLDLKSQIAGQVAMHSPARVWTPTDFLNIGPRDAVDKALQRLAHSGSLRRIDRGLYDQPRLNPLTGKPAAPDYRAVIEAISRRDQTRMLVDGMTAANDLGLSDAVPGRVVVHTDARLRPIRLDNLTITFRPTAPSKLYWAGRPAMRVVQALHWLREALAKPDDRDRITARLLAILSDPAHGTGLRADLEDGLPTLPAWMQTFLRELLKRSARGLQDRLEADLHPDHEQHRDDSDTTIRWGRRQREADR